MLCCQSYRGSQRFSYLIYGKDIYSASSLFVDMALSILGLTLFQVSYPSVSDKFINHTCNTILREVILISMVFLHLSAYISSTLLLPFFISCSALLCIPHWSCDLYRILSKHLAIAIVCRSGIASKFRHKALSVHMKTRSTKTIRKTRP